MIRNYIKTTFRSLKRNKGFTIINVLGLALGLSTYLLIIFYIADELSYDRYNTKADRIVRVNTDIKYGGNAASYAISPPVLAATLMRDFPEVEKAVRFYHEKGSGIRVKKGNEYIQEDKIAYADANIFDVFTLPMIAGNPKNALAEPNTVIITANTAQRYFNSTQVLGQTILIDGSNCKITGIIKDIPHQSHINFDFLISFSSNAESRNQNWFSYSCNTYVLLKHAADEQQLAAKLPAMFKRMAHSDGDINLGSLEKAGGYIRFNLTPLTDIHLQSNRLYELGANNSMQYIYIFAAIALFILLIACINFMNLSTARSANRSREVGVRKVLGSSRKNLIAQFLSESVIVTLIATLIALFAAWQLLPLFNQIAGKNMLITPQMFIWLTPVLLAIVIVVGILAGAYPAFFLSAFQPVHVLKGKLSAGFKGGNFRSFLVVFQFAISIFLIIGTVVIYNQLQYIQNKNLGFNRNQVLVIKNTRVLNGQAKILQQELKQLPGVVNASLCGYTPTGNTRNPDAIFNSKTSSPENAVFTEIWPVDEEYIATMGMSMAKGRNFSKQLLTDSSGIIINESAAKMLRFANDPLNKKLYRPLPHQVKEYNIIGVVKDFNFNSLRSNVSPVVMVLGEDKGAISVRTNAANIKALIGRMESKWKTLVADQHFEYSFMNKDFDAIYRSEQRIGKIFSAFTTLAIIIACLGLFGLAAYAAEQRAKEISIRKILGAGVSTIISLLSKDFIKLVIIAIAIASPLAWYVMNLWLQDFAYRIHINGWIVFVAGITAVLIACITISFQAIKAAIANPVKSLRSE
jgi:putative ABC transport system permease protein